jgi:hypothetical protein
MPGADPAPEPARRRWPTVLLTVVLIEDARGADQATRCAICVGHDLMSDSRTNCR